MSSKIGTILSMVFVALFFIFGMDMICIQFIYSDLDAKSSTLSYLISKKGYLDNNLIETFEEEYNVTFTCLKNCTPLFGEVVDFVIETNYQPIIISQKALTISVRRSAVMGYYG